jgi:hypothetical protein
MSRRTLTDAEIIAALGAIDRARRRAELAAHFLRIVIEKFPDAEAVRELHVSGRVRPIIIRRDRQ